MLKIDLSIQYQRIKIANYENKINILESLIPTYLYFDINIHLIHDIFAELPINEEHFLSVFDTRQTEEYLNEHSISLTNFKNKYLLYAKGFAIPFISTEDSWKIINKILSNKGYI